MKRTPYRMVRIDLDTYLQLAAGLKPFETVTGAVNLAVRQDVVRRTIEASLQRIGPRNVQRIIPPNMQDMARTEDIDSGMELV